VVQPRGSQVMQHHLMVTVTIHHRTQGNFQATAAAVQRISSAKLACWLAGNFSKTGTWLRRNLILVIN